MTCFDPAADTDAPQQPKAILVLLSEAGFGWKDYLWNTYDCSSLYLANQM